MFPRVEGDAFVGVQGFSVGTSDLVVVLVVLLIVAVAIWIVKSLRH